jgi:NhaA family Na+:H+ antiporter
LETQLGSHSVTHWINDGLMAIFSVDWFKLEREMYQENYRALKNAALPIFGALGGMVVPGFFTVKYWNHYTKWRWYSYGY